MTPAPKPEPLTEQDIDLRELVSLFCGDTDD